MSAHPILIVPGWQNSEPAHWQSLWQGALGAKRVEQRDWQNPDRGEWVETLLSTIRAQKSPPILICHSLACPTLAWAAREAPDLNLRGAFLVAPPDFESSLTPTEILGFMPVPQTRFPFPSLLVGSTTDPLCTIANAERFARAWGSEFVNVGDRDHIGMMANVGPWEEGRKLFDHFFRSLTI